MNLNSLHSLIEEKLKEFDREFIPQAIVPKDGTLQEVADFSLALYKQSLHSFLSSFALSISKATIEAITPEKKQINGFLDEDLANAGYNQCVDKIIKKSEGFLK